MPCFSPLECWRPFSPDRDGKRPLSFSKRPPGDCQMLKVACGRCVGCRLERSRQWAIRCMHEASLYERNCFLTLTYDDANLPDGGTLVRRDLQLFLKRMRKHVFSRTGRRFRFFGCGEYGDRTNRPHYHLLVFDFDFSDKKFWRRTPSGHQLFRSKALEGIWTAGASEIGSVTFDSAGYVARYCVKKIVGDRAGEHYARLDAEGRWYSVLPEFGACSNRPGVGQPWLDRFKADVYPDDFVLVNGRKMRPPKFYDRKIAELLGDEFELVELGRAPQSVLERDRAVHESSRARLAVKEEVVTSRMATFSGRSL